MFLVKLFYHPIKIAFKQSVLNDAVFFEFAFGMDPGDLSRYFSCIL
jgi:hypothetical protein